MSGHPLRFQNPILPGFHPDPSICRVGEDYYLVNSSFAYFPGVPVFHSRDLVHWRQIGHCLTRPEQLPLGRGGVSGGIFAPSIRWHDGVFYMITTNVAQGGNFYVTARDPAGPWSDPIWVAQKGIDPSLLFHEGRVYLNTTGPGVDPSSGETGQGILQSEIDIASGRLLTEPRLVWRGSGGAYPEGPHLYAIGDKFYLMVAEGGTEFGHTEVIARSDSPWGPWEGCPHNPILTHRSYASPIQALGHADLVEAQDGSWWLVCLGFRPSPAHAHHLGRETFLAPVTWDEHGWPVVGRGGRIQPEMEAPRLQPAAWPAVPERDDFDASQLGLKWNFLGTQPQGHWSLEQRPGSLALLGRAARLDDGLGVVFVGCRQEHFNCQAAAALDFSPAFEGEEAGLTVWMDQRHHDDLFVTRQNGQRLACLRRRTGSLSAVIARQELPDGPLTLRLRANRTYYALSIETAPGQEHTLGFGEAHYLSTEVAGGFTGVYFGLYASGNGRAGEAPAFFDWFDYRDLERPGFLGIDSTLGELLASPPAKAILAQHLPELAAQIPTDWGAFFSLPGLASMNPDEITPGKLLAVDTDLRKAGLPARQNS